MEIKIVALLSLNKNLRDLSVSADIIQTICF